jgi:hypothetical protein
VGNVDDVNGVLLYPDGEPRFRLLHTNGGSATAHGTSMGEEGRENIRQFFYAGGCYTGVCAGAFITSIHYQSSGENPSYYHIWPGRTSGTGVLNTTTGHFIEPGSPLLQYADFGNDMYIPDIYHTGGCYANENVDFPPGTEILLRFDKPGYTMHQKVSNWAYKENEESGRLVVIGSHPEDETSGEGMDLMNAMFQYALSGKGNINVKGNLENGVARVMDKSTEDNDPAYTKIGDKQYHHFFLEIPYGVTQLDVSVAAQEGYHFNIFVNKDDFAFRGNALFLDTTNAPEKILKAEQVSAGQYYIGIECETTVLAIPRDWGFEYVSNLEVLNGIEYTLQADYMQTSTNDPLSSISFEIYPNPATDFLSVKSSKDIEFVSLTDITGKNFNEIRISKFQSEYQLDLTQITEGIYILLFKDESNYYRKKIIKQ